MSSQQCFYRLFVTADSDSTFLARLSDALTSLSIVPECLHSRREVAGMRQTMLAIILVRVTARKVDLLERKLTQMTVVHGVEREPLTQIDGAGAGIG